QDPPSDTIKFWMSKADFDTMMKPYRDLASARNLISLFDQFFALRDERNELLIEFDALVTEISEIRAQIVIVEDMQREYSDENTVILLGRRSSFTKMPNG
ncbi:hypothetical protein, partial [Rhizobium leguminosarum]